MVRRRGSILSLRPRTSPLPTDQVISPSALSDMTPPKRTLSQVFSPIDQVRESQTSFDPILESGSALADDHDGASSSGHSDHGGRLRQLIRRCSMSVRDSLPGYSVKVRKNSHEGDNFARQAFQATQASPSSPSSSRSTTMKRFTSLRRPRRQAASGPSGVEARWNPIAPPLPQYLEPRIPSFDYSAGGHAARASAAAHNDRNSIAALRNLAIAGSPPNSSQAVIKDSESAVWVDGSQCSDEVPSFTRIDPLAHLPAELCAYIFTLLDARSVTRAEQASKAWKNVAESHHVWRDVYLRAYEQKVYVAPTPIQMGGVGTGRVVPNQDWKRMYQIRKIIERRWRAGNPAAIYFNGHTDSVYCCQFDEEKIITGSRDRTIRVWDINTYECLRVIGGPASRPIPPSQSPLEVHKTQTVANNPSVNGTSHGDGIYYIPSDYHSASILCLQFDEEIMVTGSSDSTCIVWDMKTYEPKFRLARHTAGVLDVCLDAKYIISCSKDASICVWDRKTGQLLKTLVGHRGPVNAVQLRGNQLVSASGDGVAKLWNVAEGTCINEYTSQDRGLAAVEFSDDARYVLAGGNDMVVYKYDAVKANRMLEYKGHQGLVRSLFLDAANNRVLSGSYDQSMHVYDYTTGEDIAVYPNWTTSWILSAKSDYRRIVATSQDGRALLLDFGYGIKGVEMLRGGNILGGNWAK